MSDKRPLQQFFKKGLNISARILIAMRDNAPSLVENLPSCYPGFDLMKRLFEVGPYKNKKQNISFKPSAVRVNLCRLVKDGLVVKDEKTKVYSLTPDGKKIATYIYNRYAILNNDWDGKFRIVIFDVPEHKKHWRKTIRQELLLMQYQQLQKSVYIGKYPLADSFCKEIDAAGLGKCIFIFTIDKIDRKEEILKMFE